MFFIWIFVFFVVMIRFLGQREVTKLAFLEIFWSWKCNFLEGFLPRSHIKTLPQTGYEADLASKLPAELETSWACLKVFGLSNFLINHLQTLIQTLEKYPHVTYNLQTFYVYVDIEKKTYLWHVKQNLWMISGFGY